MILFIIITGSYFVFQDSTSTTSDFTSRRNRLSGLSTEKTDDNVTAKKVRTEQNKENEEEEMSLWKKKRLERERERREREEKEKEQEREKEKEKESDSLSARRRIRERQREREQSKVSSLRESDSYARRMEEREKEKEKEKETDVTMSSVTRGRKPRRLREERRSTGVAYMPSDEVRLYPDHHGGSLSVVGNIL